MTVGPFFVDFDESIMDRPTDLPMDGPSYRDADASGDGRGEWVGLTFWGTRENGWDLLRHK